MILAALGIVLADSLVRVNALKQTRLAVRQRRGGGRLRRARIASTGRSSASWPSPRSAVALGGRLASRIPAGALRRLIVVLGVVLSVVYFAKWLRG